MEGRTGVNCDIVCANVKNFTAQLRILYYTPG